MGKIEDGASLQYDPLTGLHNRKYLLAVIEDLLAQAEASGMVVGLIYTDIDWMKPFNDKNGKCSGNTLIVSLAQVVLSHLPEGDLAVRYGGDKFLIIMKAMDEANITSCAESIHQAVKKVNVMGGSFEGPYWPTRPVTLTLGLSFFPRQGRDLNSLLRAADEAVCRGKNAGRDCIVQ